MGRIRRTMDAAHAERAFVIPNARRTLGALERSRRTAATHGSIHSLVARRVSSGSANRRCRSTTRRTRLDLERTRFHRPTLTPKFQPTIPASAEGSLLGTAVPSPCYKERAVTTEDG